LEPSDVLTGFVDLDSEIFVRSREAETLPLAGLKPLKRQLLPFPAEIPPFEPFAHTRNPLWQFSYSYFHVRAEDGLRQVLKEPFTKSGHEGSKLSISDAASVSP
jgi:hypothetical protein